MSTTSPRVRVRTALVWCGTTGALAVALRLARDALGIAPDRLDFAGTLVAACAVAAAFAAAWLWLLASSVAVEVIRTGTAHAAGGGLARRALVAACGVAMLAAPATAHAAATTSVVTTERAPGGNQGDHANRRAHPLDGLRLPERAEGRSTGPRGGTSTVDKPSTGQDAGLRNAVHVRPGDSLWAIAADHLGPTASTADVAAYWPEIYAANRSTVGTDPNLILPDQQLDLPTQEDQR